MKISRRDTILIAVLLNVGILAVLLLTAVSFENVEEELGVLPVTQIALEQPKSRTYEPLQVVKPRELPRDEIDQMITNYTLATSTQQEEMATILSSPNEIHPAIPTVEVTVKRGDSLERIARQHGTTVRELKSLNHLVSDRLKIGQLLFVPARKDTEIAMQKPSTDWLRLYRNEIDVLEDGSIYYIVQSGDNPWTIARKFGLKYREILTLNYLDEQKARNLKVGDRIRIQ